MNKVDGGSNELLENRLQVNKSKEAGKGEGTMQISKISDNYSERTKSRITVGRDGANQSAPRH